MATNIKLKSSSVAGKTPTLSDLSLRELAVNTADGKLFLRKGDGSASDRIIDVTAPLQATSEPMGHEDKSQSTISFNASTRVFTIQPASTSFNVWVKGIKYNFTAAQTLTIPNTTGLHYIFFDASGVLSSRTTYFDWENEAPTAYVYWNATAGTAPFVADERHGITLDWATHEYLHRTRGAVIANGFSLGNFTTTGTGSTNADSQFDLGGGTFFDEDLEVDIVHSNTPTANTWQQDLQGPARIPVFYLSGTGWVRDNPTDYALKQGTARIQYNLLNTGTWSTVDVPTNTHYTTSWIIATNNINFPVLAIMGQSQSNKISDQESISFSDLTLTNFPVVEFRPLWKIIWQTDSRYANTPKARIAGVYDIRQLSSVGIGGVAVSDHGLLTGLTDDDHLQYLHTTTTRTGVTAEFNTTGKITTTNSIGIGTTSPEALFDIWGNGPHTAQVSIRQYNNTDTDGPDIRFFTAKGTPSSPLGIQNGDITGRFNSFVYTGSSFIQSGSFGWTSSGTDGRSIFSIDNHDGTNLNTNLFITDTGNVGIGTTNPSAKLAVNGYITENPGDGIYWNVVTQKDIGYASNQVPLNQYLGQLAFMDQYSPSGLRRVGGGFDDLTVDSGGRILGLSPAAFASSTGGTNPVQFNASNTGITLGRWENATGASNILYLKSRGSVGTHAVVQNADGVGFFAFEASDGTQFRRAASISVNINGVPSSTSMPGTIAFNVTPENSVTAVERFRIGQSGLVTLGTSSGGTSAGFNAPEANTFAIVTNNLERLRVSSTGNVGIGTTNPSSSLHVQGSILASGSYETTNNIYAQGSASITGGVAASINQLSATVYRSVEYTIQAVVGTNYHVTKILAIHNGTDVSITEYGTIITNTSVASYSVDISGGNIVLTATPTSASATTFKLTIIGLKV
jgi:hypothetical protein